MFDFKIVNIIRLKAYLIVFLIIALTGCFEYGKTNYEDIAKETFLNIWTKYRVPEYDLFSEYFPQDHKPEMTYFHGSYQSAQEVAFLWPMSGVFSSVNVLMELNPEYYSPYLDSMVIAVEQYYDSHRQPPGYQAYPTDLNFSDRYYDDNGLVGIDYVDAYVVTGNPEYLRKAEEVMAFIKSGWSDDYAGGVSWLEGVRDQKPACSNGKATVLALKLYEATSESKYLNYGIEENYNNKEPINNNKTGQEEKYIKKENRESLWAIVLLIIFLIAVIVVNFLIDAQSLAEGSYNYYVKKTNNQIPYIKDVPWFVVVLFRGYHELFEIDKNPKYIKAIMTSAEYALKNARDSDGLFFTDWTGRNIQKGQPKWLLDQACMIEMFARMAILEKEFNITTK